jgi:hypothetical protein
VTSALRESRISSWPSDSATRNKRDGAAAKTIGEGSFASRPSTCRAGRDVGGDDGRQKLRRYLARPSLCYCAMCSMRSIERTVEWVPGGQSHFSLADAILANSVERLAGGGQDSFCCSPGPRNRDGRRPMRPQLLMTDGRHRQTLARTSRATDATAPTVMGRCVLGGTDAES